MKGLRHYIKTFKNILRLHGFAKDAFYTYHYRPKRADEVMNFVPESMPNVGIVIQGPLRKEDDFTIETVKLYKKYYPDSPIVVSIWDVEESVEIQRITEISGGGVILSHFKMEEGNFQRTTSLAGIQKLKEQGCEYVLKTRTDQRLYAPRMLSLMTKLINRNPIRINCSALARIIVCSMSTFSDRLYNISDMVVFGKTDDVLRYFSCPEDKRDLTSLPKITYHNYLQSRADYSKLRMGEIWFATHYIESLGYELKWTYEDSEFYRNELFLIVDDAILDLYWPKYSNKEYRWRNYYTQEDQHPVSFAEWYMSQKDS